MLRCVAAFWICTLFPSATALAQYTFGAVDVRVTTADATPSDGALVELLSEDGAGTVRAAQVSIEAIVVSLAPPSPTTRVRVSLPGFQPVERLLTVTAGELVSVDVHLLRVGAARASTAIVRDRLVFWHQTTFDRAALEGLPSSSTAWSLLETSHPFLIADRVDGGGQWPGEPARLGGQQGSSMAQTTFRLDGVGVTDSQHVGMPSIDPLLATLEGVVVQSAGIDPSAPGPGPVVDLVARRPSALWSGEARVALAPRGLQGKAGTIAPIARLESGGDGSLSAGGPLAGPRLGLFVSGRVARARRIERENPITFDPTVGSATAHLVAIPRADSELRVVGSFVDAVRPLAERRRFAEGDLTQRDRGVALHATWEGIRGSSVWMLGGAWQRATTRSNVPAGTAGGVIERLRDGPPLDLVAGGDTSRTRWDVRVGVAPAPVRWLATDHIVRLGASFGGAGLTIRGGAQPAFAELVNGRPARVWDVSLRGESRRSKVEGSAFVSDRVAVSDRFTIMTALRVDVDQGSADGASSGINWFTLTPRVTLRWRPIDSLVVTSGYAWYGHRLPLSYLAVGDPSGPAGVMHRWDDRDGDGRHSPSELTAIASVGAFRDGDAASTIDRDLRRPTTGEFRIGFEHEIGSWRWGISGLDRRERHLAALVNVGVTAADYTVSYVDDPGVDIAGRSGFEPLPIYDRRPESFGRDAYVLTNTTAIPSRYQGLEVTLARDVGDRWFFRFGGSAYRSEGVGANRGYRADENDQGGLGEVFVTPNAETNARGRLFYDRGYVMKTLGAYQGAGPLSASFVARYQDGQPFARVVVAEGLNQGAEIIQAYPRGGQRFTFALTVDARVELQWRVGGRRTVGVAVEAFNLPNMALEVEENIATGPAFRTVTAVQPPRVVRVGVRLGF